MIKVMLSLLHGYFIEAMSEIVLSLQLMQKKTYTVITEKCFNMSKN